ncbi:MAG: thioredoxin domain-containing protein [Oligoflexia bacterium]|nr:thioredoxin domain-containing protein [Oligoflexia bacterium]
MKHEARFRLFIPIVALMGAAFACVSLLHHTEMIYGVQSGPSFCNINAAFNCDAVNRSAFSQVFGIPLASYGLAFYLAILVLSFAARDRSFLPPSIYYRVLFALSVCALLISVVLFCVAEFIIGTLCLMCVGVYVANITLYLIAHALTREDSPTLSRFISGLRLIFRLPSACFGSVLGGEYRAMARTFCLGYLVLLVGVYFSPKFLYAALWSRQEQAKTINDLKDIAIKDWNSQIAISIPWNDGAAASKDYAKGNPAGPIRIDEFADFECSACRMFYRSFEEVFHKYKDRINLVFHNYPLDRACNSELDRELHKNACYLAKFARCAGEQEKFWEVSDYIFTLEVVDDESASSSVQQEVEKAFDIFRLDGDAMRACIASTRVADKIESDLQLGRQLGVTGTPSLWLNGKKISVNHPMVVEMLIAEVLKSTS